MRSFIASGLAAAIAVGAAAAQTSAPVVVAEFEGMLPCADCAGLRTQLTLSAPDSPAPTEGTFTEKYTYVSSPKGDLTREDKGTWKLVLGTPADKNAVVYELSVKGAKQRDYWLQVSADELQELDRNRRPIAAPTPLVLRRTKTVAEPPPGAYRRMDKGDLGVDMAVMFAMRDQLEKTPNVSLVEVTGAERQVVAGMNYRLCLSVRRNGNVEPARVLVFQDLKGVMHVASWTWESCGAK